MAAEFKPISDKSSTLAMDSISNTQKKQRKQALAQYRNSSNVSVFAEHMIIHKNLFMSRDEFKNLYLNLSSFCSHIEQLDDPVDGILEILIIIHMYNEIYNIYTDAINYKRLDVIASIIHKCMKAHPFYNEKVSAFVELVLNHYTEDNIIETDITAFGIFIPFNYKDPDAMAEEYIEEFINYASITKKPLESIFNLYVDIMLILTEPKLKFSSAQRMEFLDRIFDALLENEHYESQIGINIKIIMDHAYTILPSDEDLTTARTASGD